MAPTPNNAMSLAALMLSGSIGFAGESIAQQTIQEKPENNEAKNISSPAPETDTGKNLAPVTVRAEADRSDSKDEYYISRTRIGKVDQELKDIPQSVTIITEKLMTDRDMFTLKDVLKNTAGVSFLAAEGGEEDIRLRGFSMAGSGDIFVDSIRDPAFYNRDTFNFSSVELMRGSASMLFGRGSTGGVVNQVSKVPTLENSNEINTTVGSYGLVRVTGDFNAKVGETTSIRLNAMHTNANNDGAGNSLNSNGIAGAISWGIGTRDQVTASFFALETNNGINYGLPWIKPSATSAISETSILPTDPKNYYGMSSDYSYSSAVYGTLNWQHTFDDGGQVNTTARYGGYDRDQRASAIRFTNPTYLSNFSDNTLLNRGTNNKIQNMTVTALQSDYNNSFRIAGLRNDILAGVDIGQEDFTNMNATTPSGVNLTKPRTSIGTPDDGAWINEALRSLTPGRTFTAQTIGIYGQDVVHLTNQIKVMGGLRYDYFKGDYWTAASSGQGGLVVPATTRNRADGVWSGRFGLIYQPTSQWTAYASYGTSYSTSGDTYQYDALGANTPPEKSENIEIGVRWESADKKLATRLAAFQATKLNERNRDPDSAAEAYLLSGKRHAAGLEFDVMGRITNNWEIYASYAWTPIANIDEGATTTAGSITGELVGQRPSLTPVSQGSVWSAYRILPQVRAGAGVNFTSQQSPNRNPGWYAPGYATVDVMLEYKQTSNLTWRLNVNNVANKNYAASLYTGHYVPGTGRIYQLTAGLTF